MTEYTVQAPDGHTITLQGPPGASHEEVIAQAQKLYQPKQETQEQTRSRIEAKATADNQARRDEHGAIEGVPDMGGPMRNAALAAGIHFVHQLPLVGDLALTAGQAINGQDWSAANQTVKHAIGASQQAHPLAATAGGVAGGIDSAIIGGAGLKAAGVAAPASLALKQGQRAANLGRMAVTAGAAGAAQGAAQGGGEAVAAGDFPGAPKAAAEGGAQGAVAGAVLGPVAGTAMPAVAKALKPLETKTALALAKVFGESPADLQAAWGTFRAATGRAPTMAEMATLKQRGQIVGAARDSTPISTALSQAADDAAAARSASMQQQVLQTADNTAVGPPATQASGEVQNATTTGGDRDYTAARAHDFHIDTAPSQALGGVAPSEHAAAQIVPLAGLKTADRVRVVQGLETGHLSGEDAQLLRSKLNKAQGTGANYSPAVASAIEDLDDFLALPGNEAAQAALEHANTNYAAGAQRATGAEHGESVLGAQTADNFAAEAASRPNANPNFQAGMASGARSKLADTAATPQGATSLARRFATDDSLHGKVSTIFGNDAADSLRRMGEAETGAAENLAPFKNRTPGSEDQDSKDLNTGMRALAAFGSHGVYKFYHGAKALAGLGMSPAVQEKVAQYLSDPKMTQQGINLLRKAGATNAQLRQLALDAAQATGVIGESAVESVTE